MRNLTILLNISGLSDSVAEMSQHVFSGRFVMPGRRYRTNPKRKVDPRPET